MKGTRRQAVALRWLLAALVFSGATFATGEGAVTSTYTIGPKDLLEIKVFEVPELNIQRRVGEDGSINLPLIGDVPAQGMTAAEFTLHLKKLLEERYVQRASVDVQLAEFRSKPIVVIGAVKSPGNLAFSGRWTLLEALAAAGGLADAHDNVVYVMRRAENGLTDQVSISLADLLERADPKANVPIFANDLINVPITSTVTVFFLGEVASPGAIAFRSSERMTLLSGLARAGGPTARASRTVIIKRDKHGGGSEEIEVDYKRILAGKDPDTPLRAGDVVIVKESFF